MFKLIKLGMSALLGYALYEFCQGIMSEAQRAEHPSGSERRSVGLFEEREKARNAGLISGHGHGRRETTAEVGGTSASYRVGRGAAQR